MAFAPLIEPLLSGTNLSSQQARDLMTYIMSGEAPEAQIGGALIALRIKGCTGTELAAFARVLREAATSVDHGLSDVVDTCGTGGGSPSFNISTASAIIAAAAGVKLAKHGNRAVTSKCGSADVLEAVGVKIGGDIEDLKQTLLKLGIVFLFAPAHHAGMKNVGPTRRALEVRTVFNQLGPLANPAGASIQLVGVYDAALLQSMGEALAELGTRRAILAHGRDGLDEISPVTETDVARVWDGVVKREVWSPASFGLQPLDPAAIAPGADLAENAAILREAISDLQSPRFAAVLPSTATTLWIAGIANSLGEGVELARKAVKEGLAERKLQELAAQ